MAQRVYHWKHGWIPLDHYAAVEKAHGRDVAAQKLLKITTGKSAVPLAAVTTAERRRALDFYSGYPYPDANTKLRQVGGDVSKMQTKDRETLIDPLDAMLAEGALRAPISVWRGTALPKDFDGKTIHQVGYSSVTTDRSHAELFAGSHMKRSGMVLMQIHLPAGQHAIQLPSTSLDRDEILLPRGMDFRVVGEDLFVVDASSGSGAEVGKKIRVLKVEPRR